MKQGKGNVAAMLLGGYHWEYSKRPRPGQAHENRTQECTDKPRNCTWVEMLGEVGTCCVCKDVVAATERLKTCCVVERSRSSSSRACAAKSEHGKPSAAHKVVRQKQVGQLTMGACGASGGPVEDDVLGRGWRDGSGDTHRDRSS
eukprot:6469433-Amphidinium_carterae.1